MQGYGQDKAHYLRRLRRIEGQVRGLQRMVTEDAYCIDVLTQVSAVTRALQSVALGLLEDHLAHCVTQAIQDGGAEADTKIIEASDAIARLVRAVLAITLVSGVGRRKLDRFAAPALTLPRGNLLRLCYVATNGPEP
jgi:DNA-binding FrmR family transcriptional regulator